MLLVTLLALAGALAKLVASRSAAADEAPRREPAWSVAAGWALLFAALVPYLAAVPSLVGAKVLLPGDAQAHAWVAEAVAREGLPHGWVARVLGGFPFGPHYQSVTVLWLASLVRAGASPVLACSATAALASLAAPVFLFLALRAAGARGVFAAAGASAFFWADVPYRFMGSWDAYLSEGLLSQLVAVAVVLAAAWLWVRGRPRWLLPVASALVVATHAQLGVAAVAAASFVVVAVGGRALLARYAPSIAAAGVAAVAIFGPGALRMAVPFGWSRVSQAMVRTFPHQSPIDWWQDGALLDAARAPVTTIAVVLALGALLGGVRAARDRGALALFAVLVSFSLAGLALRGTPLARVLDVISPDRAAGLIPAAAGAAIAVGFESWARWGERVRGERRVARLALALVVFVAAANVAAWGPSSRLRWVAERVAIESAYAPPRECGDATPSGYATDVASAWIAGLSGARLAIDGPSFETPPGSGVGCASIHGLELATRAPLGRSAGGPGSQVGVLQEAFTTLDGERERVASRAEALGVRWLLHTRARRPASGFRTLASRGDVALSERVVGGGLVGAGCVRAAWSGAEAALRDALLARLADRPDEVLDPASLVELRTTGGPLATREADLEGCDATDAAVVERPREPGAHDAMVTAAHPVDVVIRATWFPTWTIRVDGAPAEVRRVAPGFPSVRVPAGVHRVEAVVAEPPGYVAGLLAAALAIAALSALAAGRLGKPGFLAGEGRSSAPRPSDRKP